MKQFDVFDLRGALKLALAACVSLAFSASLGVAPPAYAQGTSAEQPLVQPRLGVYLGGGCEGRKRIASFEQWLGRPIDFVVDFLPQDSWDSMIRTGAWVARCWREAGKEAVISMPMIPRDGTSTLEAGASGAYDGKIAQVAQALIAQGHGKTVIRLGWEFNASWFAWSALKDPVQYVAYWRRIVTVMRGVPGAEFRFDWNPIVGPGMKSPEAAYPGDDVVDIIGADVYNNNYFPAGVTAEQRWKAMRDGPFGLRWHRDFAQKRGKLLSFPEWGTGTRADGHGGGDDPVFMSGMVEWLAQVKPAYQAYWDYPARDYNSMLSNGRQPNSEKLFLDAFGKR